MPSALAFRYARALADVATQPGSAADVDAVTAQLAAFEALIAEVPDLKIALESPAIQPARKRSVVEWLAKRLDTTDLVRRFLCVIIDHRRADQLHDIRVAFEAVADERMGIARAEVTSARPLSKPQQQQVIDGLARLTGKQTRAQFTVQESLIGGVVARIGSTVYDGSVRGQLDALRQRLAGVES
jgi:F-type H+-transporting ATPase subunit delta